MIGNNDKERVRDATDFAALVSETVVLKPRGGDLWGCCPFHQEKSPSFKITPSTGLWHCFGCGKGGDVFDYVCEREHLDFPDAIRFLADRAGIELTEERTGHSNGPKRNRLLECLAVAQEFYNTQLMRVRGDAFQAARNYFAGRGFGSAICKKWMLGYAPGHGSLVQHLQRRGFTKAEMEAANLAVQRNGRLQDVFYDRVMFPIHDELGRCIGFGGRVMSDAKPKYLNTRETPVFHKGKHMFAYDYAKQAITSCGVAIVCEGYTDVIAMHEAGFSHAVAALGTSFSLDHVKTLSRFAKTIICMFDGDAAGQKAAERTVQFVDKTESDIRCVVLPNNQDPAEFLANHGAEALQAQLDGSRPLIDFVFDKRLSSYDLSVPGQRVRALDDLAAVLSPLKKSVLLDSYATRLSDALGMNYDTAKQRILQAKPLGDSSYTVAPDEYEPYDEGTITEEMSPAQAPYPVEDTSALSLDDRRHMSIEQELLSYMAEHIEKVRPFDMRIAGFAWANSRHEAIAWAMLATPVNTAPAQVVAAAEAVVADARQILSLGRLSHVWTGNEDKKLDFLLNQVEYFSSKRKIRQIRSQLRGAQMNEETEALFREATQLQQHVNELSKTLSSLLSPENNG
ncbi:MAG: DNA primase [Atopobium sp.]|uniref:DNA primase n=1 Tax=Atopobium sp. TaxID=1872650 RepID=UPI002A749399|nr:DNA primase [Atopobium sp.]MDY2787895.1 DNA primase [Atopobium sp.]